MGEAATWHLRLRSAPGRVATLVPIASPYAARGREALRLWMAVRDDGLRALRDGVPTHARRDVVAQLLLTADTDRQQAALASLLYAGTIWGVLSPPMVRDAFAAARGRSAPPLAGDDGPRRRRRWVLRCGARIVRALRQTGLPAAVVDLVLAFHWP